LFSKPIPLNELLVWLEAHQTRRGSASLGPS